MNEPSKIILNFIKIIKIVCDYIKNHINELFLLINIIFILSHDLENMQKKCSEINEVYSYLKKK